MKLIVANWKANKTRSEAIHWWQQFKAASFVKKDIEVVICPPVVHLFTLQEELDKSSFPFPVTLGAQDLSQYPSGTYTGEVTARMVDEVVTHVILGHSERRRWFKETPSMIAMKTELALHHGIVPVVSVDRENYRQQLGQFEESQLKKIIIMYEPPEAISEQVGPIGQGQAVDPQQVAEAIKKIKELAAESRVLYGGSVKSANVRDYLELASVDGVVPGTASMNADEFIQLINQA
jgi:triosephosphate isomerase